MITIFPSPYFYLLFLLFEMILHDHIETHTYNTWVFQKLINIFNADTAQNFIKDQCDLPRNCISISLQQENKDKCIKASTYSSSLRKEKEETKNPFKP